MPGLSYEFNYPEPDVRLSRLLADFPNDLFGATLYRGIHWAEAYVDQLSLTVLTQLGAEPLLAEPVSAGSLGAALGLAASGVPPLAWLLDRLTRTGWLSVTATDDRRYWREDGWPLPAAAALASEGLTLDPGHRATIAILAAAAAAYPSILRGEASGEDALLGAPSVGLWLDYFDNANPLYAANNRVAAVVAAAALADKPRFSIVELGAGAASGTEALIEELARRDLLDRLDRYLVTEPSAFFRRRGERRLKARDRSLPLRFGALDMDKPWAEQGIEGACFDLVYGINVLHVATDLAFSLREARAHLAAGGVLIAGECLRPFPDFPVYIEFVFQLLSSFRRVATDPQWRPRPGFLTPEEWQRSLARAGFDPVDIRPDHHQTREIFPNLFIAAVCAGNALHT